jgi:hypothetical protein
MALITEIRRSAMWHIGRYDSTSSSGEVSNTREPLAATASRFRWDSIAPLGGPVVPDV